MGVLISDGRWLALEVRPPAGSRGLGLRHTAAQVKAFRFRAQRSSWTTCGHYRADRQYLAALSPRRPRPGAGVRHTPRPTVGVRLLSILADCHQSECREASYIQGLLKARAESPAAARSVGADREAQGRQKEAPF
jgi:hypothetical protein